MAVSMLSLARLEKFGITFLRMNQLLFMNNCDKKRPAEYQILQVFYCFISLTYLLDLDSF